MNRISAGIVCALMLFMGQSAAVSLKELKKFQTEIKNACFPNACEDERQMMQPSADEIEKKLGVKGMCRNGGFDGTEVIWWNDGENVPDGVMFFAEQECLYVVPLSNKNASAHFSCHDDSCETNENAIVFVHFGCYEGECSANAMEVYLKGRL